MSLKKRIILFFAIVAISNFFIVYFIMIPTIIDIKKISQSIYAERVDLEKKYQKGQLLKETIENFSKIKSEKEKFEKSFITEGKELEFINALEKISENYGVSQNISLQKNQEKTSEKNFYYQLPLQMTLSGDFISILKYLSELETISYYFNIPTVNITAKDGQTTVNLIGEVFIKKQTMEEKST